MSDDTFSRAVAQAAITKLEGRWRDNTLSDEQLARWWRLRLATGDGHALLTQHIWDQNPPLPGPDGRLDCEPFIRMCARWIHQDEDEFVLAIVAELSRRGVAVQYIPDVVPGAGNGAVISHG